MEGDGGGDGTSTINGAGGAFPCAVVWEEDVVNSDGGFGVVTIVVVVVVVGEGTVVEAEGFGVVVVLVVVGTSVQWYRPTDGNWPTVVADTGPAVLLALPRGYGPMGVFMEETPPRS